MSAPAPGYARPTIDGPGDFDYLDVGLRQNPVINWRPVGGYVEAGINWTWDLEPGKFAFELHPDHPLNSAIHQTGIQRKAYHFRAGLRGEPFAGRIMQRKIIGKGRTKRWLYTGVCNKIQLQRSYAWVNPFFPPEVQIGLTGKQDIGIGPPDPVFKSYITRNFARLDRPVYSRMPARFPESFHVPDLADFSSLESLLGWVFDIAEDVIVPMARFTQHDELFKMYVENLNLGISVDLWDGRGTPPQVFNSDSLASLMSILDHTGDHFLDLSRLLKPVNDGLFSLAADRACYIFDTHERRDNKKTQLRTDAQGQIEEWEFIENHADAARAIVGGKAPALVNDLIEIAANLGLALIVAGLSMIPGLAGIGGLTLTVGDLFDDIFFAYQVFADNELEDDIGQDDALAEIFADNTAAWSLDSYAIGKNALKEHGGSSELNLTLRSGAADGRGVSFGADDGSARRYRCGDILTFWDDGNVVEKHVTGVAVTSKPGEEMRESLTLGSNKRSKGTFDRILSGLQGFSAVTKGIANST